METLPAFLLLLFILVSSLAYGSSGIEETYMSCDGMKINVVPESSGSEFTNPIVHAEIIIESHNEIQRLKGLLAVHPEIFNYVQEMRLLDRLVGYKLYLNIFDNYLLLGAQFGPDGEISRSLDGTSVQINFRFRQLSGPHSVDPNYTFIASSKFSFCH